MKYPKIGIRPIIDGRRGGIRESLEAMTMKMAEKLAALYSAELHYDDGTPVECLIADTTIGGVAEAAQAAENAGETETVTQTLAAETTKIDPIME